MFRKFEEGQIGQQSVLKSSVQRGITKKILDQYPGLTAEVLEVVVPKKEQLAQAKLPDHVNLYVAGGSKEILFFNQREGPLYPTLKLLHKVGDVMEKVYVDVGAIKPLIGGAQLMTRGIQKDKLESSFPADTPVQIMAEGKTLPFAIGISKMSSDDIKTADSGIGVEILHTLGDGLWVLTEMP